MLVRDELEVTLILRPGIGPLRVLEQCHDDVVLTWIIVKNEPTFRWVKALRQVKAEEGTSSPRAVEYSAGVRPILIYRAAGLADALMRAPLAHWFLGHKIEDLQCGAAEITIAAPPGG